MSLTISLWDIAVILPLLQSVISLCHQTRFLDHFCEFYEDALDALLEDCNKCVAHGMGAVDL